jgi:integrase
MRGKITKRSVDALKPDKSSDVVLWDRETRGFGVRVKPSGATSFLVSYYAPKLHRVRRRVTLGAFGALTVDDARTKAMGILARVAKGEDPASENAESRRAAREDTVAQLFKDYLEYGRAHFSERTIESYEGCGRLYVLPAIGKLPVRQVATRDVARLHLDLSGKPATANRCVQLIKAFYYWLERRELFDGKNPARGVQLYDEVARERFLTVEEMARLGQALLTAETVGLAPAPEHAPKKGEKRQAKKKPRARNAGMFTSELRPANPIALAALRFLLFTGWREQEVMTLRWADVDTAAGAATLGDTKTGKSVRILGAPALELIDAQPRVKESPYVFPGRYKGKPLESVHRLWTAVRHAAQFDDVRLHDIRHSVASVAGGHGYSLFLIGKLLGHKTARSTERYAHLADDARKTMADAVGESIRAALDPTTKASVVPIQGEARQVS